MDDEQERTVWVGNLHQDTTDEILYELFLQAGPLNSVRRPKDRTTGQLKNFAFICFRHAVSSAYAIHLTNGLQLFGRTLKSQQRNNIDLPHYKSVGVHSIDCEVALERSLKGETEEEEYKPNAGSYNKRVERDNYRNQDGQSGNTFIPKRNDPNEVWKNTIGYHEQKQNQMRHVDNVIGYQSNMNPYTNNKYDQNKQYIEQTDYTPKGRSASHYHNMNNQIVDQMKNPSGFDLRSRLGSSSSSSAVQPLGTGSNYRSTRDPYGTIGGGDTNYPRTGGNGNTGYERYSTNASYDAYSNTDKYNRSRSAHNRYNKSDGHGYEQGGSHNRDRSRSANNRDRSGRSYDDYRRQ